MPCWHAYHGITARFSEVWRKFGGRLAEVLADKLVFESFFGRFLEAFFGSFFGRFLAATDHNQEKRATCNDLPLFGRLRQKPISGDFLH